MQSHLKTSVPWAHKPDSVPGVMFLFAVQRANDCESESKKLLCWPFSPPPPEVYDLRLRSIQ